MLRRLLRIVPLSSSVAVLLLGSWPFTGIYAQEDSGFKYIEVEVVDSEGKPLADVQVDVKIDAMAFPMPTDDKGMISLNVPGEQNTQLAVSVKHKDFVSVAANWRGGDSIPEQFTIPLEKGVPIGGIVHDEQGNPIEGVKIEASTAQPTTSSRNNTNEKVALQPLLTGQLATTDEQGRWQISTKPDAVSQLNLKLGHEDYLSSNAYDRRVTWEQLQSLDHILVLEKGIELKGKVSDPDGNPIEGAIVYIGQHRYENDRQKKTAYTDDSGEYKFTNVDAEVSVVTVAAENWAPDMRMVTPSREMEPVDFQLQPGKSIQILVTDVDGVPIEDAAVSANQWRNYQTLPQQLYDSQTDAEGIWQSNSMPADPIYFTVYKQGYMQAEQSAISADGKQHALVLKWPLIVTGKVVDGESGLPVEEFQVLQGIDWGNNNQQIYWERHNQQTGRDGGYRTEFTYPRAGHYVRIEAPGYRPGISRLIRDEEGEVSINFQLEVGIGPTGTVKTPAGTPAVGAELLVATPNEGITIYNGHAQQHENRPTAKTDDQGKYQLPYMEAGTNKIVCRHESGYAQLTSEQLARSSDIKLIAWATIEGTVYQGDQPLAEEQVTLNFQQMYLQGAPNVHWGYNTQTDANGHFRFERVIGGEAVVSRSVRIGNTGQSSMSTQTNTAQVVAVPGKVVRVQIGGTGRVVRGSVQIPENAKIPATFDRAWVQLHEHSPAGRTGSIFAALGRVLAGGATAGPAQPPKFRRSYAANITPDGKFEIADVLPGNYQLSATLYPPLQDGPNYWQPLGSFHQLVNIPDATEEENPSPHDLGRFTLKMTEPATSQGATADGWQLAPATAE